MTGSSALSDLGEQRSFVARKTSFQSLSSLLHNLSLEMKTALSTKMQKQKTQNTRKTRCFC